MFKIFSPEPLSRAEFQLMESVLCMYQNLSDIGVKSGLTIV